MIEHVMGLLVYLWDSTEKARAWLDLWAVRYHARRLTREAMVEDNDVKRKYLTAQICNYWAIAWHLEQSLRRE